MMINLAKLPCPHLMIHYALASSTLDVAECVILLPKNTEETNVDSMNGLSRLGKQYHLSID